MTQNANVISQRQVQTIDFPMLPFLVSYVLNQSHSTPWSRRLQDHTSGNLYMLHIDTFRNRVTRSFARLANDCLVMWPGYVFPSMQCRCILEALIFNWLFVIMKEVGIYPLYILGQRKWFSIIDLLRLPLELDFVSRNTNVIYQRQRQSIGFQKTPFVGSYVLYKIHSVPWSRRLQDHNSDSL